MADNEQNQWETHDGLPYFPVKLPSEMYSEKSLDINPAFRIVGGKLIINSDNIVKFNQQSNAIDKGKIDLTQKIGYNRNCDDEIIGQVTVGIPRFERDTDNRYHWNK